MAKKAKIETPEATLKARTKTAAWIRQQPTVSSIIIGSIPARKMITIEEAVDGWYYAGAGYVRASCLDIKEKKQEEEPKEAETCEE